MFLTPNFSQGFIVRSEEAVLFLERTLKAIGLHECEANDFIAFWIPVLNRNKVSAVSFQGGGVY